jgi:hypothetical protein
MTVESVETLLNIMHESESYVFLIQVQPELPPGVKFIVVRPQKNLLSW